MQQLYDYEFPRLWRPIMATIITHHNRAVIAYSDRHYYQMTGIYPAPILDKASETQVNNLFTV